MDTHGATSALTQGFAHRSPSLWEEGTWLRDLPPLLGWELVPPPRVAWCAQRGFVPSFGAELVHLLPCRLGQTAAGEIHPPFVLISAPSFWWLRPANSCASVAGQLLVLTEGGQRAHSVPLVALGLPQKALCAAVHKDRAVPRRTDGHLEARGEAGPAQGDCGAAKSTLGPVRKLPQCPQS